MSTERGTRRRFLSTGVAASAAVAFSAGWRQAPASTLRLRVRETAGLRRFGYPVHTVLEGVPPESKCRLTLDGKPVNAQFRPSAGPDGVALDFNASLGPYATEVYEVAFGEALEPGPEPARGLKVEEAGGRYRVSGSGPVYEVPGDLAGVLKRVASDRGEFVRPGSLGFWVRRAGGEKKALAGLRGKVLRQGPLAVALRFEGGPANQAAVVDLTFPASKSWVEAVCTLDDRREGKVAELGLELDLRLVDKSALIDLGAGGTVYGTLQGGERLRLTGGPRSGWQVHKNSGTRETLDAASPPSSGGRGGPPAEGWAHVMDSTFCTALAFEGFGVRNVDRIDVGSDGRTGLSRAFDAGDRSRKSLRAWFHFVGTPVQETAVTSPKSMLSPLLVERL